MERAAIVSGGRGAMRVVRVRDTGIRILGEASPETAGREGTLPSDLISSFVFLL